MTILLSNQDNIDIPRYLPLKIQFEKIKTYQSINQFDFIEIPESISKNIKYFHNIELTKFIPKYNSTEEYAKQRIINTLLDKNITIESMPQYSFILKKLMGEFLLFNKHIDYIIPNSFQNNIILGDSDNNIMIITSNYMIIIINNIIYITFTNFNCMIMNSSKINYIKYNNSTLMWKEFIKDNKILLNSIITNDIKNQYTTYKLDSKNNLRTIYYHKNINSNSKILYNSLEKSNGNIKEYYIKNKLYVTRSYNHKTTKDVIISQCMINDFNSGLRYRGVYNETKINNEIVKKTLVQDDQIIYNKENNKILVDKINNFQLKKDITIGWKVAKSSNGELRLIKLAIGLDAKTVKPIDKEFFITKGKERCDKAIVMDIQLAYVEEEISVVPDEMTAYSFIYTENSNNFEYKIGQLVIPDIFDDNVNESCTNGIHYYQNRQSVFDVYIN